ncbi:MAG: MmcQ/YjbR family DNA-binding protein [Crocinitomicaceae bacterium]
MNIEDFRDYCLNKKGISESFPFDETTLVFKVMNKMFALADIEVFDFINLKCDPDRAIDLRERYTAIQPGYHMNKKLWNSVYVNDDVGDQMIYELIDHSYDLIVASLPKKTQKELELL